MFFLILDYLLRMNYDYYINIIITLIQYAYYVCFYLWTLSIWRWFVWIERPFCNRQTDRVTHRLNANYDY